MTDKELKRLSRGELLEMLIAQASENEKLKQELEDAQAALQDRSIAIDNAGSIAEAALQLSGVFEAAQNAAEQYLANIQRMNDQQDLIAQKLQGDARKKAAAIVADADEYSRKIHEEADAYWQQVVTKARALLQDQDSLRQLILSGNNQT